MSRFKHSAHCVCPTCFAKVSEPKLLSESIVITFSGGSEHLEARSISYESGIWIVYYQILEEIAGGWKGQKRMSVDKWNSYHEQREGEKTK